MTDVLLVEDHDAIRDTLADLFQMDGLAVATARTGREALERLAGMTPAVIVLDLMMPDMDGWEFLERRRGSAFQDVPVVVLTSLTITDELSRLAEAYGCLVLPKAGGLDVLLAFVRGYVEDAASGIP